MAAGELGGVGTGSEAVGRATDATFAGGFVHGGYILHAQRNARLVEGAGVCRQVDQEAEAGHDLGARGDELPDADVRTVHLLDQHVADEGGTTSGREEHKREPRRTRESRREACEALERGLERKVQEREQHEARRKQVMQEARLAMLICGDAVSTHRCREGGCKTHRMQQY